MVLLSADQQVEELKAKNEALQAESTLLYKKVRANEILFDQAKAENAKLQVENATLKKRLFNIAETYRLHTSCVNNDWAKVAITMSHIAKE